MTMLQEVQHRKNRVEYLACKQTMMALESAFENKLPWAKFKARFPEAKQIEIEHIRLFPESSEEAHALFVGTGPAVGGSSGGEEYLYEKFANELKRRRLEVPGAISPVMAVRNIWGHPGFAKGPPTMVLPLSFPTMSPIPPLPMPTSELIPSSPITTGLVTPTRVSVGSDPTVAVPPNSTGNALDPLGLFVPPMSTTPESEVPTSAHANMNSLLMLQSIQIDAEVIGPAEPGPSVHYGLPAPSSWGDLLSTNAPETSANESIVAQSAFAPAILPMRIAADLPPPPAIPPMMTPPPGDNRALTVFGNTYMVPNVFPKNAPPVLQPPPPAGPAPSSSGPPRMPVPHGIRFKPVPAPRSVVISRESL
jgi:hypothetical protein